MTANTDYTATFKSLPLLAVNLVTGITLAQFNTILSTLLLLVSITYTSFKFYSDYKKIKKNGNQSNSQNPD